MLDKILAKFGMWIHGCPKRKGRHFNDISEGDRVIMECRNCGTVWSYKR